MFSVSGNFDAEHFGLQILYSKPSPKQLQMSINGNTQANPSQPCQPKTVATRRTRSTTNKTNDTQNLKKSPIMNIAKGKPISVGSSYQAILLPECNGRQAPDDALDEEQEECVWSRNGKLSDEQIVKFCRDALNNYGIDTERALYILQRSDHILNKAKSGMYSRTVERERFSADDAFAFRDAYIYFGKNFAKIRQVLPHKTLPALVEHYYLTKKQQNCKGFTDNEWVERNNGTSDSDEEGQQQQQTQVKSELHRLSCEACHNEVLKLYSANGLELCRACKNYFKATNKHRVCAQSASVEQMRRSIPTCHPEMKNIAEQFEEMARTVMMTDQHTQFEDISDDGSGEVQVEERRGNGTVCEQKIQMLIKAQKKLQVDVLALQQRLAKDDTVKKQQRQSVLDEARKFVQNTATPSGKGGQQQQRVRMTHIWSEAEEMEAMNALIRFDGDYEIVAEVIGTKTVDMVKAFYEKNKCQILAIITERCKIIDKKLKAEDELKKKCNDNTKVLHEVILVDD